jgi:hypothetical protein
VKGVILTRSSGLDRVYASEWGELALILGGTPENSVVGRSRK